MADTEDEALRVWKKSAPGGEHVLTPVPSDRSEEHSAMKAATILAGLASGD
jgi:hypothetical protein